MNTKRDELEAWELKPFSSAIERMVALRDPRYLRDEEYRQAVERKCMITQHWVTQQSAPTPPTTDNNQ